MAYRDEGVPCRDLLLREDVGLGNCGLLLRKDIPSFAERGAAVGVTSQGEAAVGVRSRN